jgi:hypothetical protein
MLREEHPLPLDGEFSLAVSPGAEFAAMVQLYPYTDRITTQPILYDLHGD